MATWTQVTNFWDKWRAFGRKWRAFGRNGSSRSLPLSVGSRSLPLSSSWFPWVWEVHRSYLRNWILTSRVSCQEWTTMSHKGRVYVPSERSSSWDRLFQRHDDYIISFAKYRGSCGLLTILIVPYQRFKHLESPIDGARFTFMCQSTICTSYGTSPGGPWPNRRTTHGRHHQSNDRGIHVVTKTPSCAYFRVCWCASCSPVSCGHFEWWCHGSEKLRSRHALRIAPLLIAF